MAEDEALKLLVVDDNPATLYSTSRILRSAGFHVMEAETGCDALSMVKKGAHLVVLDVNLPDMDGFQVCRKLREDETTARIPVIHLSATFIHDEAKVKGFEAGADGYLTHPVEPPVLIATVNAFLRTRRAEDEMRKSEAKFKAIFEKVPNGIALLSENLIFLEVNPAICGFLGQTRDEIVGKQSIIYLSEVQQELTAITESLEKRGTWRDTFSLFKADGEVVHLDWNISMHSVPGMRLAVVTDISERIRSEEQRLQLLSSERAARNEAEKANRMKDDFLATLSHELRTPLNAIVGWAQVLKFGNPSQQDLDDGIEAIERNAYVQTQLISDLLDISRITSGKMRLDIQSVDPVQVIVGALDSVQHAAIAKNIRIEHDLSSKIGNLIGDASRLQQVIWNLVMNAVKFTPQGGRIFVKLERIDSTVQLTVTDTGEGIKPELIPYLFERFLQGDASSTRQHGGLGLGLAIVKRLVELHGGTVIASSAGPGEGSTFTVTLPSIYTVSDIDTEVQPPLLTQDLNYQTHFRSSNLRGIRVLVVDDDVDARMVLKRVLSEYGAEVHDADSVAAALPELELFHPHLLISDIGMPKMDGYEFIREVRSRGYSATNLPAIALTAFARVEDRQRALQAGYQEHLTKPVSPSELMKAIASLFKLNG